MLHGEECFPEAADFKGLLKSHVVCHGEMHFGGDTDMREAENGGRQVEERQIPEIAATTE